MSKNFPKIDTPINMGVCYRNNTKWYKVLAVYPNGTLLLICTRNGWTMKVYGAGLYETRSGMQLLWNRTRRTL